eukprot:NODE_30_length_37342_cov_0.449507.p2 type:complete len:670 gc:universal NODE_30_length_37342_cov_0.449507:8984-6975(-)
MNFSRDLLGWINTKTNSEEMDFQTVQRCFRNTVRVIQENIHLESLKQPVAKIQNTNIIVNFKHIGEIFCSKKTTQAIDYLLKANAIDVLTTLAVYDIPQGTLSEFLIFLGNIIRSMPVSRVTSVQVHSPLMKILWQVDQIQYKQPLLQLIHALTSKIRTNPNLFHIFFYKMSNQLKQGLAKNSKTLATLSSINENEWVCPLLSPLLTYINLSTSLGDVARHALVDLVSISSTQYLDELSLKSWIEYLFKSDLGGYLYQGIIQLWAASTQLMPNIDEEQLPEDSLINILLLIEQITRLPIKLDIKLECLRCSREAFINCCRDLQHLITNFQDVSCEVRLRKGLDLLSKIASVLTSKTTPEQFKAEYIIISRLNGWQGDFGGDNQYRLEWSGCLGRLFVEVLCCGTYIPELMQKGDFTQTFEDVMDLNTIHIPLESLPIPMILDLLKVFDKNRTSYPESKRCTSWTDASTGVIRFLFENVDKLQVSPVFLRYQYLLMLVIRNHNISFVTSFIPESTCLEFVYTSYDIQRELCWRLLAEISTELTDSLASRMLDVYLNDCSMPEIKIYRGEGSSDFQDNAFIAFIIDNLESVHQDDFQTALISISIVTGLCKSDFKLASYLFTKILPIFAHLLQSVRQIDIKHPFKRLVFESTLELLGVWRKRAYKYVEGLK